MPLPAPGWQRALDRVSTRSAGCPHVIRTPLEILGSKGLIFLTEEEVTARATVRRAMAERRAARDDARAHLSLLAARLPAMGKPILRYLTALNAEARAQRELAAVYARALADRTEAGR